MEVEYDIKFAHIAIVFIHLFNVTMDNLKSDQFIVGGSAACDEEKGGITAIDHFAIWENRPVSHNIAWCGR